LNELGNQQLGVLGIGSGVEARRKGKLGDIQAAGNAFQQLLLGRWKYVDR